VTAGRPDELVEMAVALPDAQVGATAGRVPDEQVEMAVALPDAQVGATAGRVPDKQVEMAVALPDAQVGATAGGVRVWDRQKGDLMREPSRWYRSVGVLRCRHGERSAIKDCYC